MLAFDHLADLDANRSELPLSALGVDAVVQKLIFSRLQRKLTLSALCELMRRAANGCDVPNRPLMIRAAKVSREPNV